MKQFMINRNNGNRKIRKKRDKLLVKFSAFTISLVVVVGLLGAAAFAKDKIEDGTLTLPSAGISALLGEVAQTATDDTVSDIKKAVSTEKAAKVALVETTTEEETLDYYEDEYVEDEYVEDEYVEDEYLGDEYVEEYVEDAQFLDESTDEYVEEPVAEETYEEPSEEVYEEPATEPVIEETTANDVQPATTVTTNSSIRQSVADLAASLVGVTQYVSAGRSLYATDCSGFVYMLYAQFGLYASPASDAYMYPDGFGTLISESELQPGDIVVYRYGGHVAVYEGNGQIVHCAGTEWGTMWSSMYYDTPSAFVRINGS